MREILFRKWMKPAIGLGILALIGSRYEHFGTPSVVLLILGLCCPTETDRTIRNGTWKPLALQ